MESRCTTGPGRPAKLTVLLVAEHRLQEGGAWCSGGASRATHSYTSLHPDNTLQLPTLSYLHFQLTARVSSNYHHSVALTHCKHDPSALQRETQFG